MLESTKHMVMIVKSSFLVGSFLMALLFFGCNRELERTAHLMTGGDPRRGREAIRAYGCATCHVIPGIKSVDGLVGPSLDRVGSRLILAGRIENTPENMMKWIRFPKSVDSETVMPEVGLSEEAARDIAAYLYTLK